MTTNTNKILTLVIAIAILLSVIVLIYVNFPKNQTVDEPEKEEPQTKTPLLFITFNGTSMNYTLEDLEALEPYTGTGGYIKLKQLPTVSISEQMNYTGVPMITLLTQLPNLPNEYTIAVTSSDNYTTNYNLSEIAGNVTMYNASGNITTGHTVTMLLAYEESGSYITDPEIGPLRIAYVDDGTYTSSSLWAKMVVFIEIIEK